MTMFWLAKRGIQEGPLTQEEAKQKIKTGGYALHHLVWVEGTPAWCTLGETPELTGTAEPTEPSPNGATSFGPPPIPGYARGTNVLVAHERHPAPWRRYAARSLDLALLGALSAQVFSKPHANSSWTQSIVLGLLSMLMQIPIETFCIEYFQTTVGKALFGISILGRDGHALTRARSFERSVRVFVFGSALQIPIASFVCNLLAYLDLRSPHGASWDRETSSVVWYEKNTGLRQFAGTMLLAFLDFIYVSKLIFD